MASSTACIKRNAQTEAVLAYLPIARTTEYGKGDTIYNHDNPARSIYLVISGAVLTQFTTEAGKAIVLDVLGIDELFGESAFLGGHGRDEQAKSIDRTCLMSWPSASIEELIAAQPRLGFALIQGVTQRNAEIMERLVSLSTDSIERRLARSLILLAQQLGDQDGDDAVRLRPFSHELLSNYIGATREIVTMHMIRFRTRGFMTYSRKGIVLHPNALATVLESTHRSNGGPLKQYCGFYPSSQSAQGQPISYATC
jgi:CRP-like cAMP-binding protein